MTLEKGVEVPRYPIVRLDVLQIAIGDWVKINFPDHPIHHPLLGLVEEVGELSHSVLKREQQIRLGEDHTADIKDAVGDILIYLLDFCNVEGIDLSVCLAGTWESVKRRDWSEHRHVHNVAKENTDV